MNINNNINDEQKTHHIFRITDIDKDPFHILKPISGYEDMGLVSLEIAVEPLICILPDIQYYVSLVKQRCKRTAVDRLSNDESASIMIYTLGWKPFNQCLYVALNEALRSSDREKLEIWFLYLKLFLTALSRLPSIQQNIYRQIELDLTKQYKIGEIIVWWAFSSCTTSMNILQSEEYINSTNNIRTLFIIESISGKNIRQHSYFELEDDEILLFPLTQFKVQSCSNYSIGLQEIPPLVPLIYPRLNSSQSVKLVHVAYSKFKGISSIGEISFRTGDTLEILDNYPRNNWWKAKNLRTKLIGYIPSNSITEIIDLTACEWYFTETTRSDATRFLLQAHNEKGTFLIRSSETKKGDESISILDFNTDQHFHVKHYRIKRTDQGLYFITIRKTFSSLQDLVNHYHKNDDGLCCLLIQPCEKIEPIIQDDLVELHQHRISRDEFLGEGNFSEVYKGKYGERHVAIKYININNNLDKVLHQAKIMKKLEHKNILRLYGLCTEQRPILILTELMKHGSLLEYLRDQTKTYIKLQTIINFALQIIDGMIYLQEQKFVHCHLAARNIFLGESDIIKIGGFHITKVIENDRIIIEDKSEFSIRWTATEIFTQKEYTIKSDIWSFGILLYELITYGSIPYSQFSDDEVLQEILNGYRMTKPNNCHDQYYQIMHSCWEDNPDNRPTFETLSQRFQSFIIYENEVYTEF